MQKELLLVEIQVLRKQTCFYRFQYTLKISDPLFVSTNLVHLYTELLPAASSFKFHGH